MGPEHFGWSGWWVFPVVMPIIMVMVLFIVFYLVFGRGGLKLPWNNSEGTSNHNEGSETAMEILKKRYAKGELTREEFEQVKKDIQS
ncbi:MAG: SHOCT domain-containing protein [Marinobacter sp.]